MKKSHGSSRNYKFGQKNNWRRTIWNDVLSRTAGREKTEPILYLAGPQDLDRTIAVEKGVPTQNMIAIDVVANNVANVREQKRPALQGDLQEVLASWPVSRPVCAVLMDFCAGLTMNAVDVYDLLERRPFRDAICMINLQRGRDAWSNGMRSTLNGHDDPEDAKVSTLASGFDIVTAVSTWGYGPTGPPGAGCLSDKHRALIWLVFHAQDTWFVNEPLLIERFKKIPGYQEEFAGGIGLWFAGNYFKLTRPHFYSYQSGVLTFDSVVCRNPIGPTIAAAESEGITDHAEFDASVERKSAHRRSPEMVRKISAMLAVRTMRL